MTITGRTHTDLVAMRDIMRHVLTEAAYAKSIGKDVTYF